MRNFVSHLLLPQYSNSHRARLLHTSSLVVMIVLVLMFQITLTVLPSASPRILGYAANISPERVVALTNQKRLENGAGELVINQKLADAARQKGEDMLADDYWAHVAPDGTEPWDFFVNVEYQYRYAGENLARDFSNPEAAIEAWMASHSHRENMLSTKYTEIGVAVIEGDLDGVDTTLIVQLFGTPQAANATTQANAATSKQEVVDAGEVERSLAQETIPTKDLAVSQVAADQTPDEAMISPFDTTRTLSIGVVGMLMSVMAIDGLVVTKKRIPRAGGRTFAHLAFLGMIFAIVIIARAGQII